MHPRKLCLALAGLTLSLASSALANTLNITSTSLPTLTLGPSADTISFAAASQTSSGPGLVSFQGGSFYLGNSPIPDQVIAFSFNDTISLNGVTKTITIFGSDNVTSSADVLNIFAEAPVNFGDYTFSLNSSSYTGVNIGESLPMTLSANVAALPTPEPTSFALLGTGIVGGLIRVRQRRALL